MAQPSETSSVQVIRGSERAAARWVAALTGGLFAFLMFLHMLSG
jgi:hypothetical protein